MIIGIDISSIPYGTGVSNYTLNLVRHLLKVDKNNIYKLFFSSLRQALPEEIARLKSHPNVRIYYYRFPPSFLEFLWNRLHWCPVEIFVGRCDVFHTWDWTEPPTSKAKKVTTVHDFVPFLYPATSHPKTIATFKRKLGLSYRESSGFICVSDNTKNDLLKLFPQIDPHIVYVIPEAAEDKYRQFRNLPENEKQQKIDIITRQYGLSHFILAQGTREPRKNLDRLVKAFVQFKSKYPGSKVQLAISGKYGWGDDITVPANSFIKILGYIPEKDLPALHAAAICLVYPSLYEGFGLPVLKSMAVGTPVITSSISSLPEVAGKAAILVDPQNIDDIAKAITRIIIRPQLRTKLSALGIAQSDKFSWDKTARLTLKVYEQLLSSHRQ